MISPREHPQSKFNIVLSQRESIRITKKIILNKNGKKSMGTNWVQFQKNRYKINGLYMVS